MIDVLKMRAIDEILVVTITFSNIWSMIKERMWGHEGKVGPNFLLRKDKREDVQQRE